MEKKTAYCLLFLVLLVPYTALGAVLKRAPQQKREKRVAVPLVYWGATVSPSVWYWLLAAFGVAAVTAAGTKRSDREGHPCGGFWNQGYCRTACFPHEYIDDYHSAAAPNPSRREEPACQIGVGGAYGFPGRRGYHSFALMATPLASASYLNSRSAPGSCPRLRAVLVMTRSGPSLNRRLSCDRK
ncbi:hypothetical protein Bbelb_279690 [Branchiostoma belcheri]|nr:hypothetical protein Bbelb_279690 [Branchiostoma belcheri]